MMALQQPQTKEDAADKKAIAYRVRDYLDRLLQAGSTRPTPQQVVDEVGCSLGIAGEVLGDVQEWEL